MFVNIICTTSCYDVVLARSDTGLGDAVNGYSCQTPPTSSPIRSERSKKSRTRKPKPPKREK
jgi:hypothetical protein